MSRMMSNSDEDYWDERYLKYWREQKLTPVHKKLLDLLDLKKGEATLDLACGCGRLFPRLLEKNVALYGIDISPAMVRDAKRKYAGSNLVVGDAESLPFKNGSFEKIICLSAFRYFKRKREVVREISRVLKLDGKALLVEANIMHWRYFLTFILIRFLNFFRPIVIKIHGKGAEPFYPSFLPKLIEYLNENGLFSEIYRVEDDNLIEITKLPMFCSTVTFLLRKRNVQRCRSHI